MTQRPSLFRQEAVDFQRHNREWGRVAELQPLSIKIITWFITAATALVIIFLFLGQYSRKETVVGYLTPTSGTSKIFVPQRGTIREITGQRRAAGPRRSDSLDHRYGSNRGERTGRQCHYARHVKVTERPADQANCGGGRARKVGAGAPGSHDQWLRGRDISASGAAKNSG